MATPEPVNIRADRMTARFNPPVISVNGFDLRDEIPADIPLQVLGKNRSTSLRKLP